ncbi:MAG: hypothetical protein ACYDDS_19025 [Candidatus Sulfotelmatobacter sp.]
MPNITEVVDSKAKLISTDSSAPGFTSVKEMRDSQARGGEGNGLNAQSFKERLGDHGASVNGDADETPTR